MRSIRAVVGCLFLLSGFCALVYEVLWCRQLGLIFGNTVQSLSAVLTAFMGGLALGSFVAGRLCHHIKRPLFVYGFLELLIGAYCLFLPWALSDHGPLVPFYQSLYGETGGGTLAVARFTLSFLLLLIPTTLMGATLPVLSHFLVKSNESLGRTVGMLYALNTFGAVLGAAATGFLLLPYLGKLGTNHVAVICNIVLGCLAVGLSKWAALLEKNNHESKSEKSSDTKVIENDLPQRIPISASAIQWTAITFGLTGFAAMATQIAWTRVISLGTGSSTYAFSLIVSVFILGLSLGGAWASRLTRKMVDPVKTLANVLLAIGLYSMVLSALLGFGPLMFYFLLAWGTDPRGGEMSWGWLLTIQALGIALLIFIPTFLMGATLPLTLQVASGNSNDAGKTVGTLYSINTLGSILGSFLGGLVILPLLQLQTTLQVMALLYTVPGFILAMKATSWRTDAGCEISAAKNRRGRIAQTALLLTTCFALLAPRWDPNIMSSGLFLLRDTKALKAARELRLVDALPNLTNREMLYYREGVSATVAVFKIGEQFTMSVGGKPDASSGMDMSTQIGLSLVPILLHPDPKDVLVIGLGSGVSTGAALARQSIQHVDVVEMSPEVVEGSAWFEPFNCLKYDRPADGPPILNTPNVQVLLNDGRNHLLLSSRKYDVIASEPSNPWLAGVGNLFTEEAFQLARKRLKAGGLMCQWIHSYNLDGSHVRSIIKTFGKVFPHIQLWWINREGDYLLIGSDDPIAVPLVALRERLAEPNVKTWLKSIHLDTEEEFLAGFVLHDGYLKRLSAKGQLHSDDNMLLEFSAPMALYASTIRRFSTEQVSPLPEKIVDWKGFSNDEKSLFLRKLDLAVGAREHLLTGPDNSLSARHLDRAWQMAPYQLFASDYYAKKVARKVKSVKLGNQNDKIPTTDDTSELRKQAVEALENQRYSEALGLFRHRYFLEPDLPEALLDLIEIHLKIVIAFEKKDDVDTQIRYACIARKLSRQLTHWKPAMPEGWMNLESAYGMLAKLDARDTVFYQSEVEKCQKESLNAISPKLNPKRD